MKAAVLLLVFLWQFSPPAPNGPATTPNPAYPLHVRILVVRRSWNRYGSQGFGRGDLMEAHPRGFDYTFQCDPPFLHNMHKDEFYQARWKKTNQELILLTQRIGSNKTDTCKLKVAMKDTPYGHYGASPIPTAQPIISK